MSSQTETTNNNRSSEVSDKKVRKEYSKKVPTGDVESENTSPFPTERNSVSTPNSLFNSPPELPNMSQTNNNVAVPSQVEENNKKVEGKKSKPKKVSPSLSDPTDASIVQKPKAKKTEPVIPEEDEDDEEVPTATPVDASTEDGIQADFDSQSPRAMISTEQFVDVSVAEATIVPPPPIVPAIIDEDDEELLEAKRQMEKYQRLIAEKEKQKQVKQQVSKASIYREQLSAETRSLSFDIWQDLEMRIQETTRKYQETIRDLERQQNEEEERREETLQQLKDATDEQVVEFYNQREAKKKPMAKKTTTKKATTLAEISAGGGGGSDDGSEGKAKRERSKIERNLDKTFANCRTIVITEEYEGRRISTTLTKNLQLSTWKKGAWENAEGTSFDTPNDAWKEMIRTFWGDGEMKRYNGKNVWEKEGRMVATSNSGTKYDMAKKPWNVIMDLPKCKGKYQGRNFEDLTDADFTQIV